MNKLKKKILKKKRVLGLSWNKESISPLREQKPKSEPQSQGHTITKVKYKKQMCLYFPK